MPPQLKTLIPLFAGFILLFLIARHFLVPVSFGEQGHYRFNSIAENKERAMMYAGKEVCADCHDDRANEMKTDKHAGLSCETCHGPGLAHTENPDSVKLVKPDQRSFCGTCHSLNPSRSKVIVQIDLKEHNVDKKCIECHNPHLPCQVKE
jgi:DnaJ-class molecular chaperone